jgi:hypothetical protein
MLLDLVLQFFDRAALAGHLILHLLQLHEQLPCAETGAAAPPPA